VFSQVLILHPQHLQRTRNPSALARNDPPLLTKS
jgi:hypothetical protein